MATDRAGLRATQVAQLAVHAALGLVILGALFISFIVASTSFYNGRLAMPEAPLLLLFVPMVLGLLWLRAFLRDVIAGDVFTIANSTRLYRIGWLMIAAALAKVLALTFTSGVGRLVTGVAQPDLLSGLLVLVLASAWRYGSELQNDRDLTV